MIEVCCVLNGNWPTGVDDGLGVLYVEQLYRSLVQHSPTNLNWRFTCFTDRTIWPTVETKFSLRMLPRSLWTWFSKLYCFSSEAFPLHSRVLYFDLDTVMVGDWGPFAERQEPMICLGDVLPGTSNKVPVPASGIMSWTTTPDTQRIWNEFAPHVGKRPPYLHHLPTLPQNVRTDEQWLYPYLPERAWKSWGSLIPTKLASWKNKIAREAKYVRQARGDEPLDWGDIRVVYFHGRPRPHEVKAVWNPWTTNSICPSRTSKNF